MGGEDDANEQIYVLRFPRTGSKLRGACDSIGTALLLLVAAEFVGANEGIGYRVWWAWSVFWVKTMYVGFAVIALLGFALTYAVEFLERRFLPWQGR